MQSFPEVDRAEWFELSVAMEKIHKGLRPVLEQLHGTRNYPKPQGTAG
jgi:predicted NUDIX family NTP pyrophosphohydrolase